MHDTKQLPLPTGAETFFNFLLQFYPQFYRKRFGQEMLFVFKDTYQEELEKKGKVGIGFWLSQAGDITKCVVEQHINEIGKKGMKKYLQQTLHINKYNVIGGILLFPAFTMFLIDLIARIVQGDLVHYNRPVYAFMSHTIFYYRPIQFIWIILFPILGIGFSLIPLIINATKNHAQVKNINFLKRNIASILLLAFGLFIIILIKFHDFVPCMMHGLLKVGFGQFDRIISVCRNA